MRPGQPAALHADRQILMKLLIGLPARWNTDGQIVPERLSSSCPAHRSRRRSRSSSVNGEYAGLSALRRTGLQADALSGPIDVGPSKG